MEKYNNNLSKEDTVEEKIKQGPFFRIEKNKH